jgi:D-alanyl-D-alanine carboxypeptidase/D-alanyl-D-alanine-endopeptidase (penicillin-binding protein 4)
LSSSVKQNAVWRVLVVSVVAACARVSLAPTPTGDDRVALVRAVDSLLSTPETRSARWGVLIVDPDRGDTLYSRDADKLLVPASNMKILTSAFALDALGPDFRWITRYFTRGNVRDSVLDGDLLVYGKGDPTVSDRIAGDAMLPLLAIADSLRAHGIRRIRGSLLAAGNAFPDATAGFEWSWEDLETSSGAQVDELLFNEGVAELHVRGADRPGDPPTVISTPSTSYPKFRIDAKTVSRGSGRDSLPQVDVVKDTVAGVAVIIGSIPAADTTTLEVTFSNPDEAFLAALREGLARRGISVGDSMHAEATRQDSVFSVTSAPLWVVLSSFLKPSQNQIGEVLVKTVALARTDTGTYRVARRLMAERLRSWGARTDGFLVWDGSGMSRRDLVSPETLAHVLDAMRHNPNFQLYYDALPVAGVDGTLRARMRSTRAEANVRGKTGTLGEVRSLSGFVTTAGGRQLIFSVLCNNYLVPTSYITRVQDSIAVRLSRLRDDRNGGRN